MQVRVATWNVWWRFGDWRRRQELIAAELARVDADVVCLQEAFVEDGGRDQPAELAQHLGMVDHRYVAGVTHEGLGFGNAILSRWPIDRDETVVLPTGGRGDEHRCALLCRIDTAETPLIVATTHLNFQWTHSAVRQEQVAEICSALDSWRPFPRPPILTGDLNAGPDCDELRLLTCRMPPPVADLGFFDAWEIAGQGAGPTWSRSNGHVAAHTIEPDRRIDYVLVGHPMGSSRVRVDAVERLGMTATDGMHPSDHFGVLATLDV